MGDRPQRVDPTERGCFFEREEEEKCRGEGAQWVVSSRESGVKRLHKIFRGKNDLQKRAKTTPGIKTKTCS